MQSTSLEDKCIMPLMVDLDLECRAPNAVTRSEKRVLVIYTGGTIGMIPTADGKGRVM